MSAYPIIGEYADTLAGLDYRAIEAVHIPTTRPCIRV